MDLNIVGVETPPGLLIVANSGQWAHQQILEFFATNITNDNTRASYFRAAREFFAFAELHEVTLLAELRPVHVAAWVQTLKTRYSIPSVKLKLTAITMLFDWLVVRHVLAANPAKSVRSPRYSYSVGKTPVLTASQARELLNSIDVSTKIGMRDRALIGLMLYTFVRIGAALAMRRSDVLFRQTRMWVRVLEKGGKSHEMPCHHELELMLQEYLDASKADETAYLFRSVDRSGFGYTEARLLSANADKRIKKQAAIAGIEGKVSCHSFRATGITTYLANRGTLELAAKMAGHSSIRTTQLYDRRGDAIVQAEVERIRYE
ncbi:tyrosine-type recombinase/integrase [Devosia rhizoryzae]|uniref:Tyrosine-type recombinase/integrase n=1 Tax=Devosia rhizoryzae TaxID=2774137 RepID=A0ABX7C491_9HYPH|nr:tyrosine-type recombinase/integrase [Devosia rhizoryzae]QQR39049.1 tyrosine-type recombinase/integrase [Devosia rhizoryzae]